MSNVVQLRQSTPTGNSAKERLEGIWRAVETFVSGAQLEQLTPNEIARMLLVFDTANQCIRLVLSDFNNDAAINQLIDQSRGINALIETARRRIAGLPTISVARASSR
jgi:hypothetical protein